MRVVSFTKAYEAALHCNQHAVDALLTCIIGLTMSAPIQPVLCKSHRC